MERSCRRYACQRARYVIYSTPTHPAINLISPLISSRSSYALLDAARPTLNKGGREGEETPGLRGAGCRYAGPWGTPRERGPSRASRYLRPPPPPRLARAPRLPRPSEAFPPPPGGQAAPPATLGPPRTPAAASARWGRKRRFRSRAPRPSPGPSPPFWGRRGAELTCMPGTCTATGEWAMAGCGGRAPPAAPLSRPPYSWAAAGPGRTKRRGGGFSTGRAPSFPPRGPPCPAAPARGRLTSRPRGWGRAARRRREGGP